MPMIPNLHKKRPVWASRRSFMQRHPWFSVYMTVSLSIALLLAVDSLVKPDGLITTALFRRTWGHVRFGPCLYDYEGAWEIGTFSGDSPLSASMGPSPLLSCSSVGTPASTSYIAEPFLVVPPKEGHPWYAFYQVKGTSRLSTIGVAASTDRGASWQHLGIALSENFPLSSPWVTWDDESMQYVMVPDSHKTHDPAVYVYTTSAEEFPFGWQRQHAALKGQRFLDTVAAQHDGRWWIFTTVKTHTAWRWEWLSIGGRPEVAYTLRLYHAESILGEWVEHPISPISTDTRYARGGGRPFAYNGHLYRWAQDCSLFFGMRLHLFRVETLNERDYWESYQRAFEPDPLGWAAARTHHADIQPVGPNNTWFGLVDGDESMGDTRDRQNDEENLGQAKAFAMRLNLVQMALSVSFYAIWLGAGKPEKRVSSGGGALMPSPRTSNFGNSGGLSSPRSSTRHAIQRLWVMCSCIKVPPLQLALIVMAVTSILLSFLIFLAVPGACYCPRWSVRVEISQTPPVTHEDPGSPYDVSDLVIVTGATANFFDRTLNMIGSVHAWEPDQKIVVYDLGYSQQQLAQMLCWTNVDVRPFPYAEFPPHVRDVTNYAFKALVLQHAMKEWKAVLWIDSGLELRAPISSMRRLLARHGHVSAMQEDSIGDPMYTMTRPMVNWFGLGERWDEVRNWQFCAGGLQGFVRGSDADRLVLQPVVMCSLAGSECMAPPGSSRKNHNFDQTAFTIAIWANNFSCLPRETHCMWSVKKLSRDPLQLSSPIEVVSRGHRQPKPYPRYVRSDSTCVPDEAAVPWPVHGIMKESHNRHGPWFKVTNVYLQPVGDLFIMAMACIGVHGWILGLFWLQVLGLWLWGDGIGQLADLHQAWVEDWSGQVLHALVGAGVLAFVQLVGMYYASTVR